MHAQFQNLNLTNTGKGRDSGSAGGSDRNTCRTINLCTGNVWKCYCWSFGCCAHWSCTCPQKTKWHTNYDFFVTV